MMFPRQRNILKTQDVGGTPDTREKGGRDRRINDK